MFKERLLQVKQWYALVAGLVGTMNQRDKTFRDFRSLLPIKVEPKISALAHRVTPDMVDRQKVPSGTGYVES